ncbi:MAG: cation:proton antiporter, partial [Acidimicrobiia bacterium]
ANDPFAIVLTIGFLHAFDGSVSASDWATFGLLQLVGGLIVGVGVGAVGVAVLRLELRSQGLYPLVATGLAGLSYSLAALASGSGFLAVYLTGLVVGAFVPRHRRVIRSFHASLANGADIGLFLMLGLLVFPSRLGSVAIPALVVTAILVLVARPLAVAVSTAPFGFSWREKAVLSWAGLRGAVPIVLATFPLTAGVTDGQTIFDVVFFVVVTSTLLQGTTTVPLVRRLGLETAQPAWRSIAEALPLDSSDIDLAEIVVSPDLGLAGATLRSRPPPEGIRVIAVLRDDAALLPSGDTVLVLGDTVVVAIDTQRAALTDVTAWARGEVEDGADTN